MKVIEGLNGHIYVTPIKETKQIGGLDLISKFDQDDRYGQAEVVYTDPKSPIEEGMIVVYDKSNSNFHQFGDEKLLVLQINTLQGIIK